MIKSSCLSDSPALVERLETRLCLSGGSGQIQSNVLVGDFNKDGALDMLVSNPGKHGRRASNGLVILLGNGNGTFGRARAVGGAGFARGAVLDLGDFNKDGNLDLVVYGGLNANHGKRNGTAVNGLLVLLGNGDGTFGRGQQVGGSLFAGSTDPAQAVNRQASVAIGDINGDTNADITISDPRLSDSNGSADNGLSDVFQVRGNGNGTFQTAIPVVTG